MEIKGVIVRQEDINRFYSKITIKEDGCWDINLAQGKGGYPIFRLGNKLINARKFSFMISNQDLDLDGKRIHDICNNNSCVNPVHLYVDIVPESSIIKNDMLSIINNIIYLNNTKIDVLDIKRFYVKISINNNGCWDINQAKDRDGYSRFSVKNETTKAHRFMYILHHPEENISNLEICHSCDNPNCVKPDHLFSGTHQDNVTDCFNKNRQSKGSMLPQSKLCENDVEEMLSEILNKNLTSVNQISNYYNVSCGAIHSILCGNSWKHVTYKFDLKHIKTLI